MTADERKQRHAAHEREVYAQKVQKQTAEQDAREVAAPQAAADARSETFERFRERFQAELALQQGYESREHMLAAKREQRERELEAMRRAHGIGEICCVAHRM